MEPIIKSIVDNDLYTFSVQNAVFMHYPNAYVAYEFVLRNKDVKLGFIAPEVCEEVKLWEDLRFEDKHIECLTNQGYLNQKYLDWLPHFRLKTLCVDIRNANGELRISICGKWIDAVWFEVPLLATVNEIYFRKTSDRAKCHKMALELVKPKIELLNQYPRVMISEFGTRRRYSFDNQDAILSELLAGAPSNIVGTSNVHLAIKHKIKPTGTQSHQWFSAHLALVDRIETAQKRALHMWLQEYGNKLGYALTDTFTSDAFFRDFDSVLSNAFNGLRQDSGDEIEFGWKAIAHYKSLGIDPRTKYIVFSNSLNIPKCVKIFNTFAGLIGVGFGVGTDLSNDVGIPPLNIVIKMIMCNNKHIVKISDNPEKAIGDAMTIKQVKDAYRIA